MLSVHVLFVPLLAQSPPHPPNNMLVPGVSVSVTWVPWGNPALQSLVQLMPPGLLVTVPEPVPAKVRTI